MKWTNGPIDGVIIKKLKKHSDARGTLTETFRLDELPGNLKPAMSYVSYTVPGAGRGPHEHREQTDIFSFIGPGDFMLRLWDNRAASETYGNCLQLFAGGTEPVTVIVPPGIVHGYKNTSAEPGMVINYPDRLYMGWGRQEEVDEVRYEDDPTSPFKLGNLPSEEREE
jgi:dTDP-4-dehydrorhamnose 3,5-epimerase